MLIELDGTVEPFKVVRILNQFADEHPEDCDSLWARNAADRIRNQVYSLGRKINGNYIVSPLKKYLHGKH